MHGLAAQDFRQISFLLRLRSEHHQRVGLDCGTDARRFGTLHGFHEGDLFQRRTRLAAESFRPAEAYPAGLANITRKFGIELALGKWLRLKSSLALAGPVLLQPRLHLLAQRVAGTTQVILRQRRAAVVEQE